ncbi:hypothetical protein OROMI_032192 [Orobanche minor]
MLVANSFDLWQKDIFFSAAEEIQQSTDIMESAYRTWLRARREGVMPCHLDELGRELQMALGTAKWQLEEFERAVRLSYRNHGDNVTISRHRHFVSVIEDQISHVEKAFKESFDSGGKKPFRWVNLDEQECDDLAIFLSGTSQKIADEKNNTKEYENLGSGTRSKNQMSDQEKCFEEIFTRNKDEVCFVEQEERKFIEMGDEVIYQGDRTASNRRTWSSPKKGTLEIVIDGDDHIEKNGVTEEMSKEKVAKAPFWSPGGEDHVGAQRGGVLSHTQLRMINWINQVSFDGIF